MEYYFSNSVKDKQITLDEEETNHLVRVKRFHTGEKVHVTNGDGLLFITELKRVENRCAVLDVIEEIPAVRRKFHLHIAIAPTKNMERMEWFIEKCVETGIDEITFLNCMHSERKVIKTERILRVAVAALKQSLQTFLPKINPILEFNTFIAKEITGEKIICTSGAPAESDLTHNYHKGNSLTVLIGPEGDFHEKEVLSAEKNGYVKTTLGEKRLRTETAGLAVCTIFNFINSK